MNIQLTTAEVISLFNDSYALEASQRCRFLERGFNDNYLIGSGSDWYIFRIYLNHKYYIQSFDDFRFELDLLEYLYDNGVPVAPAVRTSEDKLLGEVETEAGARAFALFPYKPGESPTLKTLTEDISVQLGKTFAEIHLLTNRFESSRHRYHLDLDCIVHEPVKFIEGLLQTTDGNRSERYLGELRKLLSSLEPIDKLTDMVESLDVSGDQYGIIHGDIHPGNILIDGNRLTVLDFDHCAFGWRAYDLWITQRLPEPYRQQMLSGYESVRPLSKAERDLLPVFSKLRSIWDVGDSEAIQPALARPDN